MAGRQVLEVPPASVGGSAYAVAVSFRGVDTQKVTVQWKEMNSICAVYDFFCQEVNSNLSTLKEILIPAKSFAIFLYLVQTTKYLVLIKDCSSGPIWVLMVIDQYGSLMWMGSLVCQHWWLLVGKVRPVLSLHLVEVLVVENSKALKLQIIKLTLIKPLCKLKGKHQTFGCQNK